METAGYAESSEKGHKESGLRIALPYSISQNLRGFESVSSVVTKENLIPDEMICSSYGIIFRQISPSFLGNK